jgi:hypothetical protein
MDWQDWVGMPITVISHSARATARFLRLTTSAEGLLVPSVAFLDDPSRWNRVLFLDKLPADVSSYMSATFHRTVRVSP